VLQSTGIIGSLRWWTEAVLRGMNKFVCDPTKDDRCPKQVTKNNQKILQYCSACLIFGATGMRRMFRLEMHGGTKVFDGGAINIKPSRRNRGWYLGSGLKGEIDLHIISLDRDFDDNLVLVPLTIVANWGGIGARTQHGYGVVELNGVGKIKFEDFKSGLNKILNEDRLKRLNIEERKGENGILPDIKEMFFAKVQFEAENDWWKKVDGIRPDNGRNYRGYINDPRMQAWVESVSVPISPAIKNWLRYRNGKTLWQTGNQNKNRKIENWLFGTTDRVCAVCYENVIRDRNNPQNYWRNNCRKSLEPKQTMERVAAKLNISCAYKVKNNRWELRIWGWIPKSNLPPGFDREGFLKNVKQALNGKSSATIPWTDLLGDQTKDHKLKVWREFDSSRDTVKQNETSIDDYLQSLLKDKGGT
jgi:CRISPR-associated protein Cmr1